MRKNSRMVETADRRAIRQAERAARIDALRDGRRERAHTFTDRRKESARQACRNGKYDW